MDDMLPWVVWEDWEPLGSSSIATGSAAAVNSSASIVDGSPDGSMTVISDGSMTVIFDRAGCSAASGMEAASSV